MINKKVSTLLLKNHPVHVKKSTLATTEFHNHKFYELVYVCEGMVDHIMNGEHYLLGEGNYFFLSPNDKHMYVAINSEPFKVMVFAFDPSMIDQSFTIETPFNEIIKHPSIGVSHKNLVSSPFAVQFFDDSKALLSVFSNSLSEYQQKKLGYLNVLRANLVKIIITCVRNVSANPDSAKKSSFVDKIISYVNEHYAENISLLKLCNSLGYTVPYVSRVFKEQIGMTFSEYLIKVRVQKSCSLLLSTDMSVRHIANAVGYSNTDFFHKSFRKIIGETPNKFRKS